MAERALTYRFLGPRESEASFNRLVDEVFRRELGFGIGRDEDAAHRGPHRTLVCESAGVVEGGVKLYLAGPGHPDRLPMERDGVDLARHLAEAGVRDAVYAEACRVVVSRSLRGRGVQAVLLSTLIRAMWDAGAVYAYWLSNRAQQVNSHRVLRAMGHGPRVLEQMDVARGPSPEPRALVLSGLRLAATAPETSGRLLLLEPDQHGAGGCP